MMNDINLYINSAFSGFWPLDTIEEYFDEYYNSARLLAEDIDWDEVILYAILCYDDEGDSSALISADFMLLRMDYDKYVQLCKKIHNNCRLFIYRNL